MENNITGINPGVKTPVTKTGANKSKLFFGLVILVIGFMAGILIAQRMPEWFGLSKGTAAAQAEVDATVAKVGVLIALPTDEKPTVATVTDASKVKDQQFFRNAKNNDIVLIYTKAQKAILYDPKENKIIEVGAVNINNQPVQSSATPIPSPTPSSKPSPKP
jgi:hypothetical protein